MKLNDTQVAEIKHAQKLFERKLRKITGKVAVASFQVTESEFTLGMEDTTPGVAKVEEIMELVSREFDCTPEDIMSGSRKQNIADARSLSMVLTKYQHPELSHHDIGKMIADQDQSVVYQNLKKVKDLVQGDHDFRTKYNRVINQLKSI